MPTASKSRSFDRDLLAVGIADCLVFEHHAFGDKLVAYSF